MSATAVRFDDGAGYERSMGLWSLIAGRVFLDWLALPARLRWLDVGCGSGAFTALIASNAGPASIDAVDPFEGQLAFARARPALAHASLHVGEACALPHADDAFDVATMALVLSFVPDPAKGVAEMARVVAPGGTVAAYAWDEAGGGYPYEVVRAKLREIGAAPRDPPSAGVSQRATLSDLWHAAGLEAVETRTIAVRRTFTDFDDFWTSSRLSASLGPVIDGLDTARSARLAERLRERLHADSSGRITLGARANAVRGRVPERAAVRPGT